MLLKTELDIREDIKKIKIKENKISKRIESMLDGFDYEDDEIFNELTEERLKLLGSIKYAKSLIE